MDSVGWGTPFLLVDEVVNIDEETRQLLIDAKEEDLYLSNVSPLGVPFNNLKGNSKDREKHRLLSEGRPGSNCPKQLLAQHTEFTERPLCSASSKYQKHKLHDLANSNISQGDYVLQFQEITVKTCLCQGLSDTALKKTGFKKDADKMAVTVCPGPNMAYFDKKIKLNTMVNHIYGRENVMTRNDRPNFFIKELTVYVDYYKDKLKNTLSESNTSTKQLDTFKNNILNGIAYYKKLFKENANKITDCISDDLLQLEILEKELNSVSEKVIV
jgi:hypothetical protein